MSIFETDIRVQFFQIKQNTICRTVQHPPGMASPCSRRRPEKRHSLPDISIQRCTFRRPKRHFDNHRIRSHSPSFDKIQRNPSSDQLRGRSRYERRTAYRSSSLVRRSGFSRSSASAEGARPSSLRTPPPGQTNRPPSSRARTGPPRRPPPPAPRQYQCNRHTPGPNS